MVWIEVARPPLVGELNVNQFVVDQSGSLALQRIPKDNPHILRSVAHEYDYMGFTIHGGRFKRRSPQEQAVFSERASRLGLRVLPPILINDGIIHYPFIKDAQTLDAYIPNTDALDAQRTVLQLFEDLRIAHERGIIYGDRWSRNILVVPSFGILHVDFDLEISGNFAREFEVAQAAYYTLSAGKATVIPLLAGIMGHTRDWLDMSMVNHFMRRHASHFRVTRYGGIEQETEALIDLASKKQEEYR